MLSVTSIHGYQIALMIYDANVNNVYYSAISHLPKESRCEISTCCMSFVRISAVPIGYTANECHQKRNWLRQPVAQSG